MLNSAGGPERVSNGTRYALYETPTKPRPFNKIQAKPHQREPHPLCSTTLTLLLFGECFGLSVRLKMLQPVAICCGRRLSTMVVANSYFQLQSVANGENSSICLSEKSPAKPLVFGNSFVVKKASEPSARPPGGGARHRYRQSQMALGGNSGRARQR